jgi:hypothetical protein
MTIAVAIRTDSAVVFAADSKITTRGVIGLQEDGNPRWVDQTYDSATKVVHDRNRVLMAMVAGPANIGRMSATDFISKLSFERFDSPEQQGLAVQALVSTMVDQKRTYWQTTEVPAEDWPGPTVLLATPGSDGSLPRTWRVDLNGEGSSVDEILDQPGIRLEGSYREVFSLLYGYDPEILDAFCKQLQIAHEQAVDALKARKVLAAIEKLSLWAMPIQDAIDMAVFLAGVQVEMDRFLPGTPACGGPIDVLVLQMAPEPGIMAYPGKTIHNPRLHANLLAQGR